MTEKANEGEMNRLKDTCTQAWPQGGYRVTEQQVTDQEHVAFFTKKIMHTSKGKNTKQYQEKYFFWVKFSRLLNASTDILMI